MAFTSSNNLVLVRYAAHIIAGLFFVTTAVLYSKLHSIPDANDSGPPHPLLDARRRAGAAVESGRAPVASPPTSTSASTSTSKTMKPPLQNLRHAMFDAHSSPPPPSRDANTSWTASRLAAGGEGGHFPLRGTPAYSEQCGWTSRPVPDGNCTILVRPNPNTKEGVSNWAARIVDGYILARQAGCRFKLDYGPRTGDGSGGGSVDVRRVLEPLTEDAAGSGAEEGMYDWTVPPGFACRNEERCFLRHEFKAEDLSPSVNLTSLASPPKYRFALTAKVRSLDNCPLCMFEDAALDLRRGAFPDFRLETGYACVHSNLFRLAPSADEYEPRLFDEILPALHDDGALAIAVYIRTGHTDVMFKREQQVKRGEVNATEPLEERDFTGQAGRMLRCVKSVEKKYLTNHGTFTKVVWIFLTDSVVLKEWVKSKYSSPTGVRNIQRRILITGSRGAQTRPERAPSQSDFAAAIIDWLLIGEGDVVASNKLTFGNTGGMRTARPLYNLGAEGGECERKIFVHSRPEAKES